MNPWYKVTLLHVPVAVWILQLLYVAAALLILFYLYPKTSNKSLLVLYVIGMIIVNIIWRLAVRKVF